MPPVVAPPLRIYTLALGVAWIVDVVYGLPIADGRWRLVLGSLLIVVGFGVVGWAFRTLSNVGTTGDPYGMATKLVVHGPFAYSRNPIYVAMTAIYLGASIAGNTWWPMALLPAIIVTMHCGVIHREEQRLEGQFGVRYRAYQTAVRRWL